MPINKIVSFITTDVWRIQAKTLSRTKAALINNLRMILLAFKGFAEDNCQLRASALTFYSLLSIVPVAAMAFGIAKGFGFEKVLESQLLEKMPGQEEVISQVIEFAQAMLNNTKGGLIAGIGVAMLFWTVIKVLGNIEKSFNDIWGVKENRSMGRKFGDYLSIMLLCPVLMIVSSSLTVFITSQITNITEKVALLGFFSPIIFISLKLLPYCVLWALFTFIYVFMPNTKVKFTSGLVAGIVAGTIFQMVQWGYITFQIGAAKFNAIYGSFAALPLFLVWLQISWIIVLLGAELSFSHQNVETFEFEPDCLKVSYSFRRMVSLRVMQVILKNFHVGKEPLTDDDIAHIIGGPIRLVRQLLYNLTSCGLLDEVKLHSDKNSAYQPAGDVNEFTVKFVTNSIESYGSDVIPLVENKDQEALVRALASFNECAIKSPDNILLRDI